MDAKSRKPSQESYNLKNDDDNDEYVTLNKDTINQIQQEIEFEHKFYEIVCETENFEVVAIPDENGYVVTKEERNYIEASAKRNGFKVLYRISHGGYATVFDVNTGKVGIMPEKNSEGFAC